MTPPTPPVVATDAGPWHGSLPRAGFYGLCAHQGWAGGADIVGRRLPAPQVQIGPLLAAAWSAGTAWAFCQTEQQHCLIFCGELYNAEALRRELALTEATTQAQLLGAAYRRWSLQFIDHLDGQFALAIYEDGHVHLYRDRSGAQNLFYSFPDNGRIAFATQLDALFRLPGVGRRIDRRALQEYLHLLEIAPPNTLFEGIYALDAGQLLTWSPAGRSIRRTQTAAEEPSPGYEEALDRLDGLLRHSIAARLADAANPAAFLSGGVDSSLLLALAAKVRPDLTAVTVAFADPRLDEAPSAKAVSRHLGLRHTVLHFSQDDYVQAVQDFACHAEQPMADPAIPPTILAFRHCRAHHDVVLDGSGADEAFGAMPPRHVRVAVQYASLLPGWLRRTGVSVLRHLPRLDGYAPILDFEHPAELTLRWRGFTRQEIEALSGEPAELEQTPLYRTFSRFPRPAHFQRYSAVLDAMTCDRLHHAAFITGLTVRYPYWDRSVDEFIRALPVDYRYRPGQSKRLLRDLLARQMARNLWERPKHGFDFPLQAFLTVEDFQLVRRYLLEADWKRWELVAPEEVANHARRFIAGELGLDFRVWALVMLAAWLEGHGY